jgi:hypothetical protein
MIMSFKPEWREKVIRELIEDDINSYSEHGYIDTLWFVLESGFKGYANFTDEELEVELKERDISTVFGENDD